MVVALSMIAPSVAQDVQLTYVTADGTWDCKDPAGADAGAVVLADKSYAVIGTDGKVGGYGKLFLIQENFDLPHFAIIDGYLKDELHSLGVGMRGPKDNNHDLSGEIFLTVIFSSDGNGALDWECTRRKKPQS
jgi:hypothetical protein